MSYKVLTLDQDCPPLDHVHYFKSQWCIPIDHPDPTMTVTVKFCPGGKWIGEYLQVLVKWDGKNEMGVKP